MPSAIFQKPVARRYTEERRDQARRCQIFLMDSTVTYVYDSSQFKSKRSSFDCLYLLVMTSDFAARSECQVSYVIKNLGGENMFRLEKIHTANGAKPKSEKPEIAADVLGISFLAKLPGAEVHRVTLGGI